MIRFIKAHACGNDFLIVERETSGSEAEERAAALALCARTTGVGADGIEYLEWTGDRSGRIRLYNADGSMAEISGNGTRCVAAWMAHSRQLEPGAVITLATDAGERECRVEEVETVRHTYQIATRMGVPTVSPRSVTLDEEGVIVEGVVVSTGNPHFVIFVKDESFRAHGLSWQELGRAICFHPDFPEQTNVEFVFVRSSDELAIRIFERGVGPTTSSGTGTCACSAAALATQGSSARLLVESPGGAQRTEWHGLTEEILLTGPATIIAEGRAFLSAISQGQARP